MGKPVGYYISIVLLIILLGVYGFLYYNWSFKSTCTIPEGFDDHIPLEEIPVNVTPLGQNPGPVGNNIHPTEEIPMVEYEAANSYPPVSNLNLVSGQEVGHELNPEAKLGTQEVPNEENISNLRELDKNRPYIDPQTGMLIDGPGFVKDRYIGPKTPRSIIPPNYYFLDDGANGELSVQHNLCSKSCCAEQWPTPFKQKYDPYVCKNKDKFVPSNIFCSNSFQDSGCMCLTKEQSRFLYNRGGNGRESF